MRPVPARSRRNALSLALSSAIVMAAGSPALAAGPSYRTVCERVAGMVDDERALSFASVRGLDIVNVAWEDTGRYYGSSVGDNISDVTIQVQRSYGQNPQKQRVETYLMPVIRYPNYSDKTGDVPIDKISLLVGNEKGEALRPVSLRDFLGDIRAYLHDPSSWPGEGTSLLAKRDSHVLTSAQGAFLPIPKEGSATFNPVIFNYQSGRKNPAVLTILATREGTSVTVIDNARDGFDAGGAWGQRLFFDANGQKASLTGTRESDFLAAQPGEASATLPAAGGEQGLNMVMLIQVPLKHRAPRPKVMAMKAGLSSGFGSGGGGMESRGGSDVENAVIGHGALEGPFVEMDNLPIERDARFPIRVTVQFYKATSNGVISRTDVKTIQAQIKRVYKDADYVGSLVTEGYTGRPTEWEGDHTQPPGWWGDFWQHYQSESGFDGTPAWFFLRWPFVGDFAAGPWRAPVMPIQ